MEGSYILFNISDENEFEDKNYIYEYPVGIYSLDFAWPCKKLCIEIDGKQHYEDIHTQERDKRKNEFLIKNGWKILRIKWTDLYHQSKEYLKQAKVFVDTSNIIVIDKVVSNKEKLILEKKIKRENDYSKEIKTRHKNI